ncbi:MAG: winged helix-turn-helix domain-containing protein [Candidatus Thermoplasmatota archaeon]|jgi:hypothetical protein|nr:winged helix-turn-helix domain-containing protein [Candidatus Thermoplasmatota archaeon]
MDNTIIFTKDGIKVMESVSNPLTPTRQQESIVPYDKITEYNPLDIRVIGIVPKVVDGVLKQIELRIGDVDSSPHDLSWYKQKILEILKGGREWKKESIYSELEKEFNSSDHKKLKGGMTRGYSVLTTALIKLKKDNLIENPRKGIWKMK